VVVVVILMFLHFMSNKCASEKPACYAEQSSSYFPQPFVTICWRRNFLTGSIGWLFKPWGLQRRCGTCKVYWWREGGLWRTGIFPLRYACWIQVKPVLRVI
jgi:hypothetical protein